MLPLALAVCALQSPGPITIPEERPSAPPTGVIASGEPLHVELGCARCHGDFPSALAPERVVRAPSLDGVGAERSPEYLRRYLADPLHVRPGTRMPDMLAGVEESRRAEVIEDLVHYLATRGGPFETRPHAASPALLEEGRQLYHEVGCVACHGPEESLDALYEPFDIGRGLELSTEASEDAGELVALELLDLPEKTSVAALTEFLIDPVARRRSGRMPSLALTRGEAGAIAMYLLRQQAGDASELTPTPGLRYRYYEFYVQDDTLDLAEHTPQAEGVALAEIALPAHREDGFVLVYEGQLVIDEPGTHGFRTRSDDGSRLFVDGEQIVDNGGMHAMQEQSALLELDAGQHELRITYYEYGGDQGFEVSWSGPSFEWRALRGDDCVHQAFSLAPPVEILVPDPARVQRGSRAFEELRCVNCHDEVAPEPLGYGDLERDAPGGCLGGEPAFGVPHFGLSAAQARELAEALSSELAPPPREAAPEERVEAVFRSARCYACHVRGAFTGPPASRRGFFFSNGEVDLGEEGRIPPHLDNVGAKLTSEALRRVLYEGESVRPYLVTRMPRFGDEVLDGFASAVLAADAPDAPPASPAFDVTLASAGQRLAGTLGFGCIQCHSFDGYESLGIPAVDLVLVAGRVRFPWFRELLLDPGAISMNARMPGFWIDGESPVQDVLAGDKEAQIAALWSYLSQGHGMPLPHGLVTPDGAYELSPEQGPVTAGVFMSGVSPRTLVVGLPENIHYAFDLESSRLALVWRGRFFNARGTWEGRAGELESPASDDVQALPPGPPFALLAEEDAAWPDSLGRNSALRPLGRKFDAQRRPIFRYALGEIVIEEHLLPTIREGRAVLLREFALSSPAPIEQLSFLGPDEQRLRVHFRPAPAGEGYVAEFTSEVSW